jgi:outer membrane beta-barrel protein
MVESGLALPTANARAPHGSASPGRRLLTLTRPLAAVTCLLLVLGVPPARAQAPSPPPPKPSPQTPAPTTSDGLGLDLTDEAKKPAPSTVPLPSDAVKGQGPALDETSLVDDDRVKSIQRKVFLKTHRFELLATVFFSINDPYYSKWGGSVRGSFFLSDTLAISAHGSIYDLIPTDDVRTAKANFQSRIFYSEPKWSLLGAVEWSPIYGKATIFNSIIHFDGFIIGGLGAMWTDTSSTPLNSSNPSQGTRGPSIAAEFGLGFRFMTSDWLSVNLALIDTAYVDQPAGTNKGAIQNILAINAGLSIFIPFKSTGRESE